MKLKFRKEPEFADLWDACLYNLLYKEKEYTAEVQNLFEKIKISKKSKLLDSSAGTGFIALHLREKGFNINCMDPLDDEIRVFKRKARKMDVSPQIRKIYWKDIPESYKNKKFDFIFCRGNSFIYADGGWNERKTVSASSSLKSYKNTLQIFYNQLNEGGYLYLDKFPDNEKPHKDKVGEIQIGNNKPEEIFFYTQKKPSKRYREASMIRRKPNGTESGLPNQTFDLKEIEVEQMLKEVGVDRVMTTFYSPFEEKHDTITQRAGSFRDTLNGLRNLEEIEVPISVKTIILRQNYQELPEFVNFAYDSFPSAWVSIHGLIMRGHADDNREQLVARYNDMKPYVEDALDEAIKREKNLGVFIIPSCSIDPSYWSHLSINWKQMTKEMIYISPEETIFGNLDVAQPDYCTDCLINKNCSWAWESAWKEYIDMFGTNELNKITASKLRYK